MHLRGKRTWYSNSRNKNTLKLSPNLLLLFFLKNLFSFPLNNWITFLNCRCSGKHCTASRFTLKSLKTLDTPPWHAKVGPSCLLHETADHWSDLYFTQVRASDAMTQWSRTSWACRAIIGWTKHAPKKTRRICLIGLARDRKRTKMMWRCTLDMIWDLLHLGTDIRTYTGVLLKINWLLCRVVTSYTGCAISVGANVILDPNSVT